MRKLGGNCPHGPRGETESRLTHTPQGHWVKASSTQRGNRVRPPTPAPPRPTIWLAAPCAAPIGAGRGGRPRRGRSDCGGSPRAATPRGQRASSPSMAGVPGAGPGSQLGPRRALQPSHSPEAEMRRARPPSRHCRESRRACALRRCCHRPARGPGTSARRVEDEEAARAAAAAAAASGGRGLERAQRRPKSCSPGGRSRGWRSGSTTSRGWAPPGRRARRLLTMFLGDFGGPLSLIGGVR